MVMQIPVPQSEQPDASTPGMAVLAGGCFWCTEAVYLALEGVTQVVSGYTGGARETANYRAVCSGTSGHAEAVQIHFDPARLSFGRLLQVFFAVAHDPTQRNRQGNDVGTQYRSAIFAVNAAQRQMANDYIAELNATGLFGQPIVTEVTLLETFILRRIIIRIMPAVILINLISVRLLCPRWKNCGILFHSIYIPRSLRKCPLHLQDMT
jgi:methionine-S-sulfoxide reductase